MEIKRTVIPIKSVNHLLCQFLHAKGNMFFVVEPRWKIFLSVQHTYVLTSKQISFQTLSKEYFNFLLSNDTCWNKLFNALFPFHHLTNDLQWRVTMSTAIKESLLDKLVSLTYCFWQCVVSSQEVIDYKSIFDQRQRATTLRDLHSRRCAM